MKRLLQGIICGLISGSIIFSSLFCITVTAQNEDLSEIPLKDRYSTGLENIVSEEKGIPYYSDYEAEHSVKVGANREEGLVTVALKNNIQNLTSKNIDGKTAILFDRKTGSVAWEITVAKDGMYNLSLDYIFDGKEVRDAQRMLKLDGELPFKEAENFNFSHLWCDNDDIVVNSIGDEIRPTSYEKLVWQSFDFSDSEGLYALPLEFWLTAGTHTIELSYMNGDFYIGKLSVFIGQEIPTYKEYIENNKSKPSAKDYSNKFQSEQAISHKNSTTLILESDGDPATEPAGITSKKLNIIGGWRWRSGNQAITWEINVNQDGFYKISMRCLQNWNDGLSSYRQILIDDTIPFMEMSSYGFEYLDKWTTVTLSDKEKNPYLFYLTKGTHTLTMRVKVAGLADTINAMDSDIVLLSDMLSDITKLTGSDPDPYYDYDFFKKIPDLQPRLTQLYNSLDRQVEFYKSNFSKLPAMANNLKSIMKLLETLIDDQYKIAKNVSELENAQSSLGTYYDSLKYSPLTIDYFDITSQDVEVVAKKESGFFKKIYATFLNFLISFFKDYDNIGGLVSEDVEIKETINVWISRGTEWSEIIKQMADKEFTPETGIAINMNVLPSAQLTAGSVNALMLAISSDRAPDVAMGVDANSPAEFAFRNAVVDLSEFSDFDEVSKRFLANIFTPYKYNGGTFALPETMNFQVMFYRKDIFGDLKLDLPDTWTELYKQTLPTLYQNGYEFFYPTGGYAMFLLQKGGSYYSEDGLTCTLGTAEGYQAFKEFCEIFTNYAVPVSANFFNRFRSGVMPLGIGDYGTYMTFWAAAPELRGKWAIAPLPGVEQENGEINRAHSGIVDACDIIMQQSKKKEASWEFLKWWTSEETQTEFAYELEATVGTEARWNSANIAAFSDLPWSAEDYGIISNQWQWAEEIPVVLGSYYTARYVGNAWNNTVVNGMNYKDALSDAIEEIEKEMNTKQEEYGITK